MAVGHGRQHEKRIPAFGDQQWFGHEWSPEGEVYALAFVGNCKVNENKLYLADAAERLNRR
ncbi:protein of unknown function [Methylocaldum szegediense]|uniref:Uncharacterized protein n=1 Tax=Methylocaldum szegediense TaxID=73780 RepID=A0ABN8XAN3_9GAMM|nr:protein of unknown function [Methylocaldum szegediense]